MREAFVILIVVFILLGLTAVRYRKQIAGMLQIWRVLKDMRQMPRVDTGNNISAPVSQRLVSCAKCGTWVPESTAVRLGPNTYYCSKKCLTVEAA